MNIWLLLLPLLSFALGALVFKLLLYSMFGVSRRKALASMAIQWIREESGLTDGAQVKKLLPLAEQHVDHFLRHKLTVAMPMVAMFIGDKTIAQFKSVFMEEMDELLPVLEAPLLGRPILAMSLERIFNRIYKSLSIRVILIGGGLGLGIGALQLFILYFGHFLS